MGCWYLIACGRCGYEARCSGGPDSGMMFRTATIHCRDCRDLFDVEAGPAFGPGASEPLRERLPCPQGPDHRTVVWTDGDPCPRCAAPLWRPDRPYGFWD